MRVGIRAEDLVLAGEGEAMFDLAIDYVEELGAQRLVHGLIGDQPLTAVLGSNVPLGDRLPCTSPRAVCTSSRSTPVGVSSLPSVRAQWGPLLRIGAPCRPDRSFAF